MRLGRPFALVRTTDQWLRAAHRDTYVEPARGVVQLDWVDPIAEPSDLESPPSLGAGMAFDASCKLYRSRPAERRLERYFWADPAQRDSAHALDVFEAPETPAFGDFAPPSPPPSPLGEPRGLAIDRNDRLFVADSAANQVLVIDLWSRRILRVERFAAATASGPSPVDLASHDDQIWVVTRDAPGLYVMTARRAARRQALDPSILAPSRVACSPSGRVYLLDQGGTSTAAIHRISPPGPSIPAPYACDVELESEDVVVIARHADREFQRLHLLAGTELTPLRARGYDGQGIIRAPDGSLLYFTAAGKITTAVPARLSYKKTGEVITHRLDCGEFQTTWGRLFLDACIPDGTEVRVAFAAADDIDEDEVELARTPPARTIDVSPPHPALSPPMPPQKLAPADEDYRPLHPRETGRELAWLRPEPGDPFLTYEAPIIAPPARYLWVFIRLSGTSKLTPRVRSLRAEYPSHDYLRRLPRFFSREEAAADFLRRYLAMFDGFLFELEAKAAARELLLDPHASPEEALPWLASFMGLVLDERWPLSAKRTMIAETGQLFRLRGTRWSLERMIEIAIGTRPIMIEHFRLRGLGGAILGNDEGALTSSVLGAGFRVGAAIGEPGTNFIQGDGTPAEDPFAQYAHRFSVVIPGRLSAEQVDIVRFILDRHRPAHTIYDLCLVDAGMRLGVGLHLGLSSLVGRTGGFESLTLGSNPLGRTILGRPEPGVSAGNDIIGVGMRLG